MAFNSKIGAKFGTGQSKWNVKCKGDRFEDSLLCNNKSVKFVLVCDKDKVAFEHLVVF